MSVLFSARRKSASASAWQGQEDFLFPQGFLDSSYLSMKVDGLGHFPIAPLLPLLAYVTPSRGRRVPGLEGQNLLQIEVNRMF